MKSSGVVCPGVPITLKFKIISVPAPARFCAWNAEIIKWPLKVVFAVIDMLELIVPACVKQALPVHARPPAGCTMAGL